MILYGVTNAGTQRFHCKECLYAYTFHNRLNKINNEKTWFNLWITEGYSIRQVADISSYSHSKIKRIVQYWLDNPPESKGDLSNINHILFDGTFVHGRKSIVALMDSKNNTIQAGQYGIQENSIPQLTKFFYPLLRRGLHPKSATVDGNPQVIKLIQTLWSDIIVQRCLVHIQRQGLMWCRRFPKRTDAKHLRRLFQQVTYIRTKDEKNRFLIDVKHWENRFGSLIDKQREKGRVFSDIKRARSMLLKAIPNMFYYLDNQKISFSTNGLEGYFSRLKVDYRKHRGLSPRRRENYFKWYFILKNR